MLKYRFERFLLGELRKSSGKLNDLASDGWMPVPGGFFPHDNKLVILLTKEERVIKEALKKDPPEKKERKSRKKKEPVSLTPAEKAMSEAKETEKLERASVTSEIMPHAEN